MSLLSTSAPSSVCDMEKEIVSLAEKKAGSSDFMDPKKVEIKPETVFSGKTVGEFPTAIFVIVNITELQSIVYKKSYKIKEIESKFGLAANI